MLWLFRVENVGESMKTSRDKTDPKGPEVVSHSACATTSAVLHLSSNQADHIAVLAKALGHPVRVQIIDILSRYGGEICVCEIEQLFSLTQPTISHHLKVLRQAGIVAVEQRGLWAFYYLKADGLGALIALLEQTQTV
jgi:ArsR family transcriptional regulator